MGKLDKIQWGARAYHSALVLHARAMRRMPRNQTAASVRRLLSFRTHASRASIPTRQHALAGKGCERRCAIVSKNLVGEDAGWCVSRRCSLVDDAELSSRLSQNIQTSALRHRTITVHACYRRNFHFLQCEHAEYVDDITHWYFL